MEINKRGNIIERSFEPGDRYRFDFSECTEKKGWLQYDTDQDAHYFGIWVHPKKMEIVSYIEGDVIIVKCKDKESFKAEIKSMNEFYGAAPPAFTVYDFQEKTITDYIDNESRLLSK